MSDDLSGFSMMELFLAETESQTAILSAGLLTLETADASPATIEPMMRAAHSLKGAARIVGVEAAVRVAHALEDCFVAAQRGTIRLLPPQVDILLRAVDLLTQISQVDEERLAAWHAENEAAVEAMVDELLRPSRKGDQPLDPGTRGSVTGHLRMLHTATPLRIEPSPGPECESNTLREAGNPSH